MERGEIKASQGLEDNRRKLRELIQSVGPLDASAMDAARKRQDSLAKPPGSLGLLEELSIQLAGISGNAVPAIAEKCLLVFAADNGVTEEGVACAPISVTRAQTINLTKNKTGGSVLASHFGCRVRVCDVGVAADLKCADVIHRKIAYGTGNIRRRAAMTEEQALQAILTGAQLAQEAAADGADAIGVGEMGIGNTTTSAAVLSVLCGVSPEKLAGRGGGATDEMLAHKKRVIKEAVRRAEIESGVSPDTPLSVLCELGGFDIAAMAGAFLGGAASRIPVVIDGVISAAAALLACKLCPDARLYMVASHKSAEYAYVVAMERLGLTPLFDLHMRLGEGSGCPLAFAVLEAACAVIRDVATFAEAEIDDGYLEEIRK